MAKRGCVPACSFAEGSGNARESPPNLAQVRIPYSLPDHGAQAFDEAATQKALVM